MRNWTGADAVAHLLNATDATTAFAEAGSDNRRLTRLYRVLAFAVHPDRATLENITPADAEKATKRLNELYAQAKDGASKPKPKPASAPHVIGKNGTYLFADRISVARGIGASTIERRGIATYATDRPGVRIEIASDPKRNTAIGTLAAVTPKLDDAGLAGFVPTILDTGVTDGRAWIAYQLPDGLHTLREVRAAYPNGLDGRDWAWMARRLFMVLDIAGLPHGELTPDTVHIHPEGHGIVLSGWTGQAGSDGPDIAVLFQSVLDYTTDSTRQWQFTVNAHTLAPAHALREYDLLLRALYGERRYRPFTMPA